MMIFYNNAAVSRIYTMTLYTHTYVNFQRFPVQNTGMFD